MKLQALLVLFFASSLIGCEKVESAMTIDYRHTFADVMTSAHLDLVAPDINSDHFPKQASETGTRVFKIRIFDYGSHMSAGAVQADMHASGFRAATLYELLSYTAAFPNYQYSNLVALGSVLISKTQDRRVVRLQATNYGRTLSLYNCHVEVQNFDTANYFLGLQEVPRPNDPTKLTPANANQKAADE